MENYNINKEAANISTLSSDKIDKYEYFTGKEILPSNQNQMIEKAKFTYLLIGKTFEKQTKTIEGQGEKQTKAIENHGKQLAETNVLIRKDDFETYDCEKKIVFLHKKKYLMNFI